MKQNLFKKILILGLTMIMSSCNNNSQNSGNDISSAGGSQSDSVVEYNPGDIMEDYASVSGHHFYQIKYGTNKISKYKILVPEANKHDDEVTAAVSELQYFINLAANTQLPVISDESYQSDENYLSLGKTKAFEQSKLDFSSLPQLEHSGVLIKSDSNNVYLLGGEPFGLTYSVYEFLKHEIDLETYGNNEYSFTKNDNLVVHEFDLFEKPDIGLRIGGYGCVQNNTILRNRMKFNTTADGGKVWMGPKNLPYHNTFGYLPPEQFMSSHPKWFSDDGNQLCFTAHGDKQEQEAMFSTFMDVFIDVVMSNPDSTTISITQQDIPVWCECSECSKLKTKYGTDSASIIIFANKVSDALKEYFEANNIQREIDILLFAYHKTTDAPAKLDASGKWVPIDEEVVCRDNVCCFYAPINAEFKEPINSMTNVTYDTIMKKWEACSKKFYLWFYGTNFSNYLLPMNNFNAIGPNYKYAFDHGAKYMYDQGQWNQTISTGWSWLKCYLQSKALWNTELNINELIEKWFNGWFKEASKPMKDLFDAWNTFTTTVYNEQSIGVSIYTERPDSKIFPKSQIDYYLSCIQKAYEAIEPLKSSDPARYSSIYDRILLESIAYRYVDYFLYQSYYSYNDQIKVWNQLKADISKLGISHFNEVSYISEYIGY